MAERLVPVDAEAALISELTTRYAQVGYGGVAIGTRIPAGTKPSRFVRVLAVGGAQRDLVYDAVTVVIEGWSTSEAEAQRLAAHGLGALGAAGRDGTVGGVPCGAVSAVAMPANLPDPDLPTHRRYTATATVALRRATA